MASPEISNDHLDDLVDEWHTTSTGMSMGAFIAGRLGWTQDDVKRWVENPDYRPAYVPTQAEVMAWVKSKPSLDPAPLARAAKACEEMGEVIGAVIKHGEGRKTVEDIALESAQAVLCLMSLAEAVGFDLQEAIAADWATMQGRVWHKLDGSPLDPVPVEEGPSPSKG